LAGFWIDTAILNTHCENNVAVTGRWTVACHTVPISHGNTAIAGKKKVSCIFTGLVSLLSGYSSYIGSWAQDQQPLAVRTPAWCEMLHAASNCQIIEDELGKACHTGENTNTYETLFGNSEGREPLYMFRGGSDVH
jgi:hypothetical protein